MSLSAVVLGGVLFFVKLLVVFVLACVFENTLSRTRFMLTGRLTVVGFGISVLAFVFYFTGLYGGTNMERLALITIILPFVGAFIVGLNKNTLLKLLQYLLRLLRWEPC